MDAQGPTTPPPLEHFAPPWMNQGKTGAREPFVDELAAQMV